MKTFVRRVGFIILSLNLVIFTNSLESSPNFIKTTHGDEDLCLNRLTKAFVRLEKRTGGSVGVGSIHLKTGRSFYYHKDIRYPMASTYKIPIAVTLLSLVEKGEIGFSDMIEIKESDLHPGSGTIARLLDDPGVVLSVQNLLELMLLISDNSATDLCLDLVGGSESVTHKMRTIGIMNMDINRPTYVAIANFLGITSVKEGEPYSDDEVVAELSKLTKEQRKKAAEAFSKDKQDTSTPAAMTKLLKKIWNEEILTKENSRCLLDIMRRCQTGEARIKGILPPGTVVYHKTGTIGSSTNDVGIIKLPGDAGSVITVIFIKEAQVDNEQSEETIAQIARTLYDYFLFTTE